MHLYLSRPYTDCIYNLCFTDNAALEDEAGATTWDCGIVLAHYLIKQHEMGEVRTQACRAQWSCAERVHKHNRSVHRSSHSSALCQSCCYAMNGVCWNWSNIGVTPCLEPQFALIVTFVSTVVLQAVAQCLAGA